MTVSKYIKLSDLEIYKLSRGLSSIAWKGYEELTWQDKRIMGDQFVSSVDSVGANIAEGYGRYHYLDKVKFYYNSRGSLSESCNHWLELLYERGKISKESFSAMKIIAEKLSIKLNNFINSTYQSRDTQLHEPN